MTPNIRGYACTLTVTARLFLFKTDLWRGQAFAIDETHLVTNHHVVGQPEKTINDFLLNGKKLAIKRIFTAEALLGTEDDLAIIECAEPHGIPVAPIAATAPTKGDALQFINQDGTHYEAKLHAIGNNLLLFKLLDEAGMFDLTDPGYSFGKQLAKWRDKGDGCEVYYAGLKARHGDSGSAVFNENGEIVGVLFGVAKQTEQSMVAGLNALNALITAYRSL